MEILEQTMTFGQWLTAKRESLRLRATDCARLAEMTVQRWSDYEKDRSRRKDGQPTRPAVSTIKAIAKGLGINEAEVFEALIQNGIDYGGDLVPVAAAQIAHPSPLGNDALTVANTFEGLPQTMKEQSKKIFLAIAELAGSANMEKPPDSTVERRYIAIDLKNGLLLCGDDRPDTWIEAPIDHMLLRELITRLMALQSQNEIKAEDFDEIFTDVKNSTIPHFKQF